jgi:Ca2+-binding RTX toxin-like protein
VVGEVENLTLTGSSNLNGLGNALDNVMTGNAGNDTLLGGGGNDTLSGAAGDDTLNGGAGNDKLNGGDGIDRLVGGAGADILTGGLNADIFVFLSLDESTVANAGRDAIMDFSQAQGDKIDVSPIDANTTVTGDQAFAFISAAAFSGTPGELRTEVINGNTLVSGDVNGNGVADFAILVRGVAPLQASDFNL